MIDNPFEAESFASIAAALSINVGTPTSEQMQAMQISAQTVASKNTPWVLDPVGYGAFLKWRSEMVDQLVLLKPNVIRGNASEISALAGNQVESKGQWRKLFTAESHGNRLRFRGINCSL
ncbi:unnamed protein product [Oppiella nova]|uniref:hydroxyethylthiazole kinase n=1 Tax=Oppiella nova TaxID=334625 RepID=A0A7R9L7Q5_9ACAR|nr:unnamed protein product [Oppiella nova]CAG2156416.1 unnamed protein product [Oppiella nova]